MQYDHYWSRHRPAVFRSCGTMVWHPKKNHKRQGPPIYLTLRQSISYQARDQSKSIHSLPPPNRRLIGAQKPMGRTISPPSHLGNTRRLGQMANNSVCSAQQPEKSNHRSVPKSNPDRIRHPTPNPERRGNKQRLSGTTNRDYEPKKGASDRGPE